MSFLLALTLAVTAATSTGSAVEGTIPERSLQRTVQLVYLEKVEGAAATALWEMSAWRCTVPASSSPGMPAHFRRAV